jgi:ferredoxin-NADP reductase
MNLMLYHFNMTQNIVKIKSIQHITHDVLQIVTERPQQYNFIPGQATEVSINKNGWQKEKRPFTFTCLPENDYLEFTIKTYPSHKSVTNQLLQLTMNDELILHEIFGTIAYKNEGLFVAGGAGITPFISIFRHLKSKSETGNNKLIFANKTKADIILEQEFESLLGNNFINILSDEKVMGYAFGQISEGFLKSHISVTSRNIYLCGPPPMMAAVETQLANLNIDEKIIIKEAF